MKKLSRSFDLSYPGYGAIKSGSRNRRTIVLMYGVAAILSSDLFRDNIAGETTDRKLIRYSLSSSGFRKALYVLFPSHVDLNSHSILFARNPSLHGREDSRSLLQLPFYAVFSSPGRPFASVKVRNNQLIVRTYSSVLLKP